MPSLASMRSIDPTETHSPLGPPVREVREAPKPVSQPTQTPGIVRLPDGKLATELPLPPAKPVVRVHDSICFDIDRDWVRSLATSPEMFQQEFMADFSDIEQRVSAFYGGAIGKLVAKSFGTSTGRMRSSTPHFYEVNIPKIDGRRADFFIIDDLERELP